jgi:hypothetical protein
MTYLFIWLSFGAAIQAAAPAPGSQLSSGHNTPSAELFVREPFGIAILVADQ